MPVDEYPDPPMVEDTSGFVLAKAMEFEADCEFLIEMSMFDVVSPGVHTNG